MNDETKELKERCDKIRSILLLMGDYCRKHKVTHKQLEATLKQHGDENGNE
jgi:hypothetical protein